MQPEAAGPLDTAANRIVDASHSEQPSENPSTRQRLVIRIAYNRDALQHPSPIQESAGRLSIIWMNRKFRLVILPVGMGLALLMVVWLNAGRVPPGQAPADSRGISRSGSAATAQSVPKTLSAPVAPDAAHSPNDRRTVILPTDTVSPAAVQIDDKAHPASPTNAPLQQDMLQALREKRDLLHAVRLAHFDWHPDQRNSVLLLDLKIRNSGSRRIDRIELICTQYSKDLTLLETAKIPLEGPLDPIAQRSFKSLVGGLMNPATRRVQCLISDASAASVMK